MGETEHGIHSFIPSLTQWAYQGLTVYLGTEGQLGTLRDDPGRGEVSPSTHGKVCGEAGRPLGSGCPGSHHTQRGS